jgi:hypothetical protein
MNEPQEETNDFTIYSRIIGKSAPLPMILAIFLGVSPFLNVSLGPLEGLIKLAIWVLAGVVYVNNFLASKEKVSYINVAFNAAILAGGANLVGELVYWVVNSIQGYVSSIDVSVITTSTFQGIIIGALTAVGWLFYKNNQKS